MRKVIAPTSYLLWCEVTAMQPFSLCSTATASQGQLFGLLTLSVSLTPGHCTRWL